MADTFRCLTCGQDTPRYFMVEGRGSKPRVCVGCALDQWIPPGYQKRERYRPACPGCGGELSIVKGPGKEGERLHQCSGCGLRWEDIELTHLNATRRPSLGVMFLDRHPQTIGEALLMSAVSPRY